MATRKTTLALLLALAACSRGVDDPADGGAPAPELVRAAEPLPYQFLVVLKLGTEPVAGVAASLMQGSEGTWLLRSYDRALRGFALHASEASALAIARDPRVAWVAEDGRVRAQALTEQAGAPAGLDRVDQRSGTDGKFRYHSGAGEGVHAYVLDTGILASHVEFDDRTPDEQDFVGDGNSGDCNGHGTHVAGILGGATFGVAKKVSLHSLRVLGCDGTGATSDIVAALDWLVGNAQLPAVANLSLGRDADAALDAAVAAVVAAGIPVVVAAGDGARDACATSPARVAGALAVASADATGGSAAGFSNQGPCIDLFAPGVDVLSAGIAPNDADPPAHVGSLVQSGTSQSAPFVAGAVALYLGRFNSATPAAVSNALFANSTRAPATLDRYTPDRFLFTTFVDDDNSADLEMPEVTLDSPLPDTIVTGSIVGVTAAASDDVAVTRVELFANGRFIGSDDAAPYEFTWDSRREPNGSATLFARAYDKAGNAADSEAVAVTVENEGVAHLDVALGVPMCETIAPACDSVDLLRGRAGLGPERNAPNTLQYECPTATDANAVCVCADGPFGKYELDESIEQITVTRLGGGELAVGSNVQVDVQVYIESTYYDALDLFSSPTVIEPAWRYLGTLQAEASGLQTLSASFTLPEGGIQAVRAALRYGGMPSTCTEGGFDERDDLAFTVASGTPDTTAPTNVAITQPTGTSKVSGRLTVAASAEDDHLVSRIDFLVGTTTIGSAFAPPFSVGWNSGVVPDGRYEFTATAYDGAGNATESLPLTVEIDDETDPVVAIISPLNDAQIEKTPIMVKAVATDNGIVKRVELWVNGGYYATDLTPGLGASWEFTWAGGVGDYEFVARAFDGAGNWAASTPVTVHIGDTVDPTCAIVAPTDLSTVVGTVMVEAIAGDDRGVAEVRFFLAAAGAEPVELPDSVATSLPYATPWETGRLLNGDYTLYCVAKDESGNSSPDWPAASTVGVSVEDLADPMVAIVSPVVTYDPSDATLVIATPVSGVQPVEASAGDDGAVQKVEFFLDDATEPFATAIAEPWEVPWNTGTVVNGEYALTAKASDFNGHSTVSEPVSVAVVNVTPPSVAIVFPLGDATLAGDVPVRAAVTEMGAQLVTVELLDAGLVVGELALNPVSGLFETYWASDAYAVGAHALTVRATDLNGLEGSATVDVDLQPTGAVYGTAYAAPACLAEVTQCHSGALLDGRSTLGPEAHQPNTIGPGLCGDGAQGTYHQDESIDFVAVRNVGGGPLTSSTVAEVEVHAWVFDPLQDRVEVFSAADASDPIWVRLPPPTLDSRTGKQVLTVQYTLPNGAVQAVRASIRYAAPPGDVSPCLMDDYSDHDDLVFAVAAADDASPPSVALSSPADGASVSGVVTVTADAHDDVAIASVEFLLDGAVVGTDFTAPYEWLWDTTGQPEGTRALAARATDYAGKTTESDAVVVTLLDQLDPTVTLTAPMVDETVMGTLTLAAAADDAVGVNKVVFSVGGVPVATDYTAPYAASWNSASKTDGRYTITATAYDDAGNESVSEPATVLVSNFGNAKYDATLHVPGCATAASKCFTGTLVNGRGPLGPEPSTPNTLGGSCADGVQGTFHVDESVDAITVRSTGLTLTAGGTAIVEVKIWAGQNPGMDALDLYRVANPSATTEGSEWVKFATLVPTRSGPQVLSASYTLPAGSLHAVRAQLRYAGEATFVCGTGTFDDRDDLVFAANP